MAQDNNNNRTNGEGSELKTQQDKSSIGNQQATTQTGAQNAGGENIDEQEDQYTEDLRQSGDRNSSNRKEES
jgi:hypothetical protein